jgi:hypothetical protein
MTVQETQCCSYVIAAERSVLLIAIPGKGYSFLKKYVANNEKLQEILQLRYVCVGKLKGRMLA